MALAIDHKLSFNGMTIDHATSAHVRDRRTAGLPSRLLMGRVS